MIFALILFGYGPVISFGYDPLLHAKHRVKVSFLTRGISRELWVWKRELLNA